MNSALTDGKGAGMMKQDLIAIDRLERGILDSGVWGTIGPHSLSGAAALAACVGATYGLLCHSADAAYESLLRAFGCAHGDSVAMPCVCSPSHVLIGVITGVMPVFCADMAVSAMPDPDAFEALLTPDIRVAVVDFPTECDEIDTESYPLDRLFDVCHRHGVPLILDAGGVITAKWHGQALVKYADAVVYSFGKGSQLYAGMGGLVATDSPDVYSGAFAYHNCGRSPGEGCTLNFDDIVGGDFRVTEWTAGAAELLLSLGDFSMPVPRTLCDMRNQPLYGTDYCRKMTGAS